MNRLFCFGLGFSAAHFVRTLDPAAWQIAGTRRAVTGDARQEGVDLYRFSSEAPLDDPAAALGGTTHLLVSVPPDEQGDPVLRAHRDDLLDLCPGLAGRWSL